jgi:hypothetical protein
VTIRQGLINNIANNISIFREMCICTAGRDSAVCASRFDSGGDFAAFAVPLPLGQREDRGFTGAVLKKLVLHQPFQVGLPVDELIMPFTFKINMN